jgi:hypothetical protein
LLFFTWSIRFGNESNADTKVIRVWQTRNVASDLRFVVDLSEYFELQFEPFVHDTEFFVEGCLKTVFFSLETFFNLVLFFPYFIVLGDVGMHFHRFMLLLFDLLHVLFAVSNPIPST